jgi:hypothetical protein
LGGGSPVLNDEIDEDGVGVVLDAGTWAEGGGWDRVLDTGGDTLGILDDAGGLNVDEDAAPTPFDPATAPEAGAGAGEEVDDPLRVVAEDVDETVGTDTGIGPVNIVLLLCLGLPSSKSPLLFVFVEAEAAARIPALAVTPAEEGDIGEGSIVLLLCLGAIPGPRVLVFAPRSALFVVLVLVLVLALVLVLVVVVVVVVVVVLVEGPAPRDIILDRAGREVTLNEGVGARCLISIGAILSRSCSCSCSSSSSRSSSRSDTGDCGKGKDCALALLPFKGGDFFLNFVGERLDVALSFSFSFSSPFSFPNSPPLPFPFSFSPPKPNHLPFSFPLP